MEKDKTKQVWYFYRHDKKALQNELYEIINEMYILLGQRPHAETSVILTRELTENVARYYGSLEVEEIRFALKDGLTKLEPPVFVNVPTWNKILREYKASKGRKIVQKIQDDYSRYIETVDNVGRLTSGEGKKIG